MDKNEEDSKTFALERENQELKKMIISLKENLRKKEKIIDEQNKRIMELTIIHEKGKERIEMNKKMQKKLNIIVKTIEAKKKKEIQILLSKNKKELKKKRKEVENTKKELKKLKKKMKNSKSSKGGLFTSTSESFDFGSESFSFDSEELSSKAFQSGKKKLDFLEKDKKALEKKLKKYENITKVLTSSNLLNYTYKNDKKAIFVRGYLGYIVKQSMKNEKSKTELKFFEELNGNYLEGKENCLINPPLKEEEKAFFPTFFGYWEDYDKLGTECYKLAIERGKSDLEEYIGNNHEKLKFLDRIGICYDVICALDVIFSHNLIHGDIKPQNILVFSGKKIKLLDFEDVSVINGPYEKISGTYNYLDPLAMSKEKRNVSLEKREMYSIIGTVFFILTGTHPFSSFLAMIRTYLSQTYNCNQLPKLLYSIFISMNQYEKEKEIFGDLRNKSSSDPDLAYFFKVIDLAREKKSFFPIISFLTNDKPSKCSVEKKEENIFKNYRFLFDFFCQCCAFSPEDRPSTEILKIKFKKILNLDNVSVKFGTFKDSESFKDSEIKSWKKKNVEEWLDFVSIFLKISDEEFIELKQQFSDFDGKKLLELRESDLLKLGITQIALRKSILFQIANFVGKDRNKWINNYIVFKKLKKIAKFRYNDTDFEFLSKSLSDIDALKETYLNPKFSKEEEEKILDHLEENLEEEEEEEIDIGPKDEEEDVEPEENSSEMKTNCKIPMKLVITDLKISDEAKHIRKFLSPIIRNLPSFRTEFGIFHSSIIIGPWIFEWNKGALIIPKRLHSGMALFAADLDSTMLIKKPLSEILDKIAKCVVKWNTTMNYSQIAKKGAGNCQNFVEDLMNSLQCSLNKEGAFGKFIEEIRKSGKAELVFKPSEDFKKVFNINCDKFEFETHEKLDNFVYDLSKLNGIAMQMDFKEEYKLLKSFDRAFWLRHFRYPKNKLYQSAEKCPFNDPRDTKSYMTYD